MRQSPQLQTIFHVLLSYAGFLLTNRLLCPLLGRLPLPLGDWVTDLAAFLTAVLVFLGVYTLLGRQSEQKAIPRNDRRRCSVPMTIVHVGYGFFWLVFLMFLVLLVFPVEGDPVREELLPRLLTAVLVHPLLEEILFRRICQDRLLTLSEVRTETEMVEDGPAEPKEPVNTRAGMLFAVLTQALLFALVHTGGGGMLYGFGGGVVLGTLMLRTGRLWVPVVCHMLVNLRSVACPYLPEGLTYGLDFLWLAVGLACGVVFWIHRYRKAGEEKA